MSQLRRTIALLSTVGTACLWIMDNIDRIRSGNDYLDWARHHVRGMHGEEAQACAVAGGQLDALPEEACKADQVFLVTTNEVGADGDRFAVRYLGSRLQREPHSCPGRLSPPCSQFDVEVISLVRASSREISAVVLSSGLIHGPVTCHLNIYAPATEPTCKIVHVSNRDGAGGEILYTTCDTTIVVDAEGSDHDNVRLRRQHGY